MGEESGGEEKEKWERRLVKATFLFLFNGDCPSCLFLYADGLQGLESTVLKLTYVLGVEGCFILNHFLPYS